MPSKAKYTKEQIINAALGLMRKGGIAALTARALARELGCSSQPIFFVFKSMNELQKETKKSAWELYHSYVLGKGADSDAFRRSDYIRFAKDEPMLFNILFMTAKKEYSLNDILSSVFINTGNLINAVHEDYGLSHEKARILCSTMWIFIHGIACLCATGMTLFIQEEIDTLVQSTFDSILQKLKDS